MPELQAEELQPDVMVDLVFSWILGIGRRGTDGQIVPLRLELTRAAQNRELLESHFGCRVRFKSPRNALVFRNSDLDRPFVTQNEELLKAIGAQLEAELQERNTGPGVGDQVKHTLKRSLAGKRPTLQQVARELCTSTRTLQRRLTDAKITFQQLVEETRRELAHHYLRAGDADRIWHFRAGACEQTFELPGWRVINRVRELAGAATAEFPWSTGILEMAAEEVEYGILGFLIFDVRHVGGRVEHYTGGIDAIMLGARPAPTAEMAHFGRGKGEAMLTRAREDRGH